MEPYFTDIEEDPSPASDVPIDILEDEIRYLLDIKERVDRETESRRSQLEKIKTAVRYLEFYDGLDPF
ncbi:hypothetical protein KY326_03910 [Candidatus Woesearchaeota archaeon]|nr:hypothetical protein [Candidatus Woesearchaeota archaeon]